MSYDFRIERVVAAPPDEVFEMFVDPEALRAWFSAGPDWVVDVEVDARVGGTIVVSFGPSGGPVYREDMTITELDRPRVLAYDLAFTAPDAAPRNTHVEFRLAADPRGTVLTLVHSHFESSEERDAMESGWPAFLDRIEALAAAGSRSAG